MKLILTCEHGGNQIPPDFQHYFEGKSEILETHRGYDLGAFDAFHALQPLAFYAKFSETSRLLIELNRSKHHKNLFSEISKKLTKQEKENLIAGYYSDYRNEVENEIGKLIENRETVLHLSIHSFTPVFDGETRNCDIGLLFDSRRKKERAICEKMKEIVNKADEKNLVRFNYPYLGKADGFTTHLRKQFPKNYLGIEIEINQKFSSGNVMDERVKIVLMEMAGELLLDEH